MIANFDDFCLYIYYLVDETCKSLAPHLKRSGPSALCSDSELMAIAIIGECKGWDVETEMLSNMKAHRSLFPNIPTQSRFNRRRRNLMCIFNMIRQSIIKLFDLAKETECMIDSLPIPVVKFHLVPSCSSEWASHEATFGHVSSKKQTIFGYKLHLLATKSGIILDFVLAPANEPDLAGGEGMLFNKINLTVIGDKAYISESVKEELKKMNNIDLLTLPRKNQKKQAISKEEAYEINRDRQIIETVNGQLVEQMNIETNHAHTFWGLCTRLYTKLTAHTICQYINWLIGNKSVRKIKHLAFSN